MQKVGLSHPSNQLSEISRVRLNVSVTESAAPKAAEGQPQSKTCRNLRGPRSREASWTAAVLLPLLSRRLQRPTVLITRLSPEPLTPSLHHSTTPSFHHSIIPS